MPTSTLAQQLVNNHQTGNSIAKLGAKHVAGSFQRTGQAWFCTTGLPSDVTVEVDEMLFHLHKFPLISRSGKLSHLVAEATANHADDDDTEESDSSNHVCHIQLPDMPGGPDTFELAAKFCYGIKLELSATNVAPLRCAAEYLHMTEEYGEHNLVVLTEGFLNHVITKSWKDSVTALKSCEALLPHAERASIVKKCMEAMALKACGDVNLSMVDKSSLRSPGGTVLWNGISTGASKSTSTVATDWWYEDVTMLSLPLFKCVIGAMEEKGLNVKAIAGALMHYAKKHIPGLNRRQGGHGSSTMVGMSPNTLVPSQAEQIFLLETVERLFPSSRAADGPISVRFLISLLKVAMILNTSEACKTNLERRIGAQLEQATVDDMLIPNYSYSTETLYDVDCLQRIMQHFLCSEKTPFCDDHGRSPFSINNGLQAPAPLIGPLRAVAKLLDAYLGEVAPDTNLKPAKFQALAQVLPHYARMLDDGLYRAIDIFIKAHSWMSDEERETLCRVMDCRKFSLEACTHASQNERLPMRVVIQVLFMEHMQLRTAIVGTWDSTLLHPSAFTPHAANTMVMAGQQHLPDVVVDLGQNDRTAGQQNQHGSLCAQESHEALRMDFTGLRRRIAELERECSQLRGRLGRKAAGWATISSKLTCRSVSDHVSDNVISGGPLQSTSRLHVTCPPAPQPHMSPHMRPSASSSSSMHFFYSPSPQRKALK